MTVTLSATLAANEDIERRRRAGEHVLHLAFGEAGLPVHPALRDKLVAASDRNGYGPVAGAADLRSAAAGYWTRRGLPTDPELVVCGPGQQVAAVRPAAGDRRRHRPAHAQLGQLRRAGRPGRLPSILVPTPPARAACRIPDLVDRGRAARAGPGPDRPLAAGDAAGQPHRARSRRRETIRRLVRSPASSTCTSSPTRSTATCCTTRRRRIPQPGGPGPRAHGVTTGLSKSLAIGGWRIGVSRLPTIGLRDRLLAVASEIWSSPAAPVQEAAAYAFTDRPSSSERIDASRRLHGTLARAVHERFVRAGARVAAPAGRLLSLPPLAGWTSRPPPTWPRILLDEHGVGVLAGHVFGDDPRALRVRVATSLLYGDTTEQRLAALNAPTRSQLPWISASLDHLSEALTGLYAMRRAPLRHVTREAAPAPVTG